MTTSRPIVAALAAGVALLFAAAAADALARREARCRSPATRATTSPGPGDWFTGAVHIDTITTPTAPSRLAAAGVHFTPGARTAWHTDPLGQTINVTEGVGLCQRRGGPVEVIRPGDRVFFEPAEDHWHGAAANRFMTHIAMQEADDTSSPVTWASTSATRNTAPPRPSTSRGSRPL